MMKQPILILTIKFPIRCKLVARGFVVVGFFIIDHHHSVGNINNNKHYGRQTSQTSQPVWPTMPCIFFSKSTLLIH